MRSLLFISVTMFGSIASASTLSTAELANVDACILQNLSAPGICRQVSALSQNEFGREVEKVRMAANPSACTCVNAYNLHYLGVLTVGGCHLIGGKCQ